MKIHCQPTNEDFNSIRQLRNFKIVGVCQCLCSIVLDFGGAARQEARRHRK